MLNVNIIDGEVEFLVDDFASLKVTLYNKQKTFSLLSFNGELRDLYYRNNSFFRLQDQKYELSKLISKYSSSDQMMEAYMNSYLLIATFYLDVYSRYTREIDTLWIGQKTDFFIDLEELIHKFDASSRIMEINNLAFLDLFSVAQFACVIINENQMKKINWENIVTLLRDNGEILIWGCERYEENVVILEQMSNNNEIDIWLIDRECYVVRIKPHNYLPFVKNIKVKTDFVKVLKEYAEITFSFIDAVIENTELFQKEEEKFDAVIRNLNFLADALNEKVVMFNNIDLKYEILEVENALLDLKFQKEIYGYDLEFFIEELKNKSDCLKMSLDKNVYEV